MARVAVRKSKKSPSAAEISELRIELERVTGKLQAHCPKVSAGSKYVTAHLRKSL